jgi:hypothetical protein
VLSRPWPMRSLPLSCTRRPTCRRFGLGRQVEQVAAAADALAEQDVELGLAEGRGQLVLDDLDAGAVADHHFADLDGADATDVEADCEA